MTDKLEKQKQSAHDEKIRRRKQTQDTIDENSRFKKDLKCVKEWLSTMTTDLKKAKRDTKLQLKSNDRVKKIADKQLAVLKDLKTQVGQLKDELADESHERATFEKMATIRLQIKRETSVGRRGGSGKWPVHIVLLICELLTNGTPPSAVPANIQSTAAAFNGCEADELPSVNFVRQCRTVLQNLNSMLAGFRLGNAKSWHQIFTDGTTRRQIAFQNLVIGLMEGGEFDSVIASSCIILENETSAIQVESIKEEVSLFHIAGTIHILS